MRWVAEGEKTTLIIDFEFIFYLRKCQLKVRSVNETFRNDGKRYMYISAYIAPSFFL